MQNQEPLIRVATLAQAVSGEGSLYGQPSARLKVGATGQPPMTSAAIFTEMRANGMPYDLVITGEMQREPLDGFVKQAQDMGYKVACVTDGTAPVDWFANLDVLVIMPPSPSSDTPPDLPRLHDTLQRGYTGEKYTDVSMHIIVQTDDDYLFARNIAELHPSTPLWLGAASPHEAGALDWEDRFAWLSQRVIDDHWRDVQVVPHIPAPT